MSRAIDADELIHRIGLIPLEYEHRPAVKLFYSMIEKMPTLTPPNEWVSVEERLPEGHAQVLMWSARWEIAEAGSYYNQHFWVYSEIGDGYIADNIDNITHWMLLPAPPEKEA